MPIEVYRIATDAATYQADDLSGVGAARDGGRWNVKGARIVYTSTSRALTCLETLVHLSSAPTLPFNRYLVTVTIPQPVWDAREICPAVTGGLIGWDAEPAGMTSQAWGTRWAQSARSALVEVPSVMVPEEINVLINPGHPDAGLINARKIRMWTFDPRLRDSP